MDRDEDIYAAAERQLTLLEEKLNAAEGGLCSVKNVLTVTKSNLCVLDGITKGSKRKKNFRVEGSTVLGERKEICDPGFVKKFEAEVVKDIKEVLETQFCPTEVVVQVEDSCGGRLKVGIFIVSEKLKGLAFYKKHKLVETAVKSIKDYENRIHSVVILRAVNLKQCETGVA